MPKNMSDNYYSEDDYDQEYAEGYSAYKYDNEDYDSEYEDGYEDDPEYAEEEYVDDYIDECLDDADYDVSNQESIQDPHRETPHASEIAPHHIMLGAAGAALGHAALKKSATKHRQQQAPQSTKHAAPQSTYATEWDKKIEGRIMNGCAAIVAAATIIFFVWLLI